MTRSHDGGLLSCVCAALHLVYSCEVAKACSLDVATCSAGYFVLCREVVERRTYTVTGQKASPEEIDRLIETGESEQIFQKAILEQGRGHVRPQPPFL